MTLLFFHWQTPDEKPMATVIGSDLPILQFEYDPEAGTIWECAQLRP